MNLIEVFRIALESLLINRLRSVLTTLGIIIGVGAVISLISLGRGVEDYIAAEFQSLGATLLEIGSTRPESATRTRVEPLTTVQANMLANPAIAPSIRNIGMEYRVFGSIVAGSESTSTNVRGVTANYSDIVSWQMQLGDFILDEHVESAARVAVIGLDIVEALYADRTYNPVGESIRINDRVFSVIGVMAARGGTFVSEDNVVFIPISTAQTRLANVRSRDGGYQVSTIYVDVVSEERIPQARREIEVYMDAVHDVRFQDERDYDVSSEAGLLDTIGQISGILTIFLAMIASISLLVGGIGIMNIMLVSVTERTREIGLRKAVGAQAGHILSQFLMESIVLSVLGGFVGILVAYLVALLVPQFIPNFTMSLDIDVVVLATGISTFVGVFFGYYPARRAANMKPIDALRFE